MPIYKVHFDKQTVYVEASEEAEADFTSRNDIMPDSIDEVTREEALANGAML